MRQLNQAGVELIKSFESWSATPYQDPIGIWTIGYGAIYGLDGKRVTGSHRKITKEEGLAILRRDLNRSKTAVLQFIDTPLNDNQFAALVSFTFNLGAGALQRSTLRRVINRQEWDRVERELTRWVYAGGRKFRGLVRRRGAEYALFSSIPEIIEEDSLKNRKPKSQRFSWFRRRRLFVDA